MAVHDELTQPRRRRRRAFVVAALAGALLLVDPANAALADPTPPTDKDVRDARRAVDAAEQSVAQMEVRLAELSAAADQADVAVQRAGEAYSQALSDAQAARAKADAALERSAAADDAAEDARQELMAFARQMARSGGSVDTLEAVLSADGFADVASRTATLDRLTGKADEAVQTYRAAQQVAATLRTRAEAAAQDASQAEAAAQGALETAQQVQADAQRQVDAAATEREALLTQLAAARQTSADVERARQEELDRQRRAREEEAARQARLGSQTPSTPPGGGATNPGGGTGSSPGGGTTDPGTGTPGGGSGGSSGGQHGLGTGTSRGSAAQGQAAVAWAKTQVGKAYVWGAAGPDSYDCSGLTMMSWRNAGVNINRTSRDQYKGVLKITYDELRPGDLVFWTDDPNDANAIYHVALWAGDGMIVEASKPGVPLRVTPMRWANTMPYAGRP